MVDSVHKIARFLNNRMVGVRYDQRCTSASRCAHVYLHLSRPKCVLFCEDIPASELTDSLLAPRGKSTGQSFMFIARIVPGL